MVKILVYTEAFTVLLRNFYDQIYVFEKEGFHSAFLGFLITREIEKGFTGLF